jgi:hypothetical protein
MPLVIRNRVLETTATNGTGTVTLLGASSGFQSFSSIGNGNTTYYAIVHQTLPQWELGLGTYTALGTTLSRDTIIASSNSGSAVSFSVGTKDVFCDTSAGRAIYQDGDGYLRSGLVGANDGLIESPFVDILTPLGASVVSATLGLTDFSTGAAFTVIANTLYYFEVNIPYNKGASAVSPVMQVHLVGSGGATFTCCYAGASGQVAGSTQTYMDTTADGFCIIDPTATSNSALLTTSAAMGTTAQSRGYFVNGTIRVTVGGTINFLFYPSGVAFGSNTGNWTTSNGLVQKFSPLGPISGTSDLNIGGWA